ncbi:MAG: ATP-binding protein [Actinomycetes bacterium]
MAETLRLRSDLRAPAQARRWVVSLCRLWSCEEIAHTAALLVSELVTNAILHAHSPTTVTASFESPRLSITVRDDEPGQLTPPSRDETSEAGRGLLLVHALAEDFGVRSDTTGKTVWFVLLASEPPRRGRPHVPSATRPRA